jgi:hypothetical protein
MRSRVRHSQLTWIEDAALTLILWLSVLILSDVAQWGGKLPESKRAK